MLQALPCFIRTVMERPSFSFPLPWSGSSWCLTLKRISSAQPPDRMLPTGPNWREVYSLRWTYVIFLFGVFYFILIFGKYFHIWIVKLKGMKKGSAAKVSFTVENSGVRVGPGIRVLPRLTLLSFARWDISESMWGRYFRTLCVPLDGYTHLLEDSKIMQSTRSPSGHICNRQTDRRPAALCILKGDSGYRPGDLRSLPPIAAIISHMTSGRKLTANCMWIAYQSWSVDPSEPFLVRYSRILCMTCFQISSNSFGWNLLQKVNLMQKEV